MARDDDIELVRLDWICRLTALTARLSAIERQFETNGFYQQEPLVTAMREESHELAKLAELAETVPLALTFQRDI